MGKILIAGGAGYIGSHVNKELNKKGFKTIVYDNLSTGNKNSVIAGEFLEGDIADKEKLNLLFKREKIDAVMHFAAFIDVAESVKDPAKYYYNNVVNTLALLDAMRKNGVNNFIFSSSAAIYGMPQADLIDENHPCAPINPYGQTKLIIEKVLEDYDSAYGLKYCSLRYFNAAGGDHEGKLKNLKLKETNLIPVLLRNLKNNNSPSMIFGTDYPTRDGTCVRDYIHIIDLAAAHIEGLKQLLEGKNSNAYNLGCGSGFTVQEVIDSTSKVTGIKLNIVQGPRREGDPHALIADSTKAYKNLHWKPQFTLTEMVDHAWRAYFSK
jgi:UDP-glucose 4-epimerase